MWEPRNFALKDIIAIAGGCPRGPPGVQPGGGRGRRDNPRDYKVCLQTEPCIYD